MTTTNTNTNTNTKTQTRTRNTFTAALLLAIAAIMPACDILEPPCDPYVEVCEFTNNHPSGLG